jgi:hypothetical protein
MLQSRSLHTLCGPDERGIHHRIVEVFLHHLAAFLYQAFHSHAFFALRARIEGREDFVEAVDVPAGLFQMLLKPLPQLVG